MLTVLLRWLTLAFWVLRLLVQRGRRAEIRQDVGAALMALITVFSIILLLTGVTITIGWQTASTDRGVPLGTLLVLFGLLGTLYVHRFAGRFWLAKSNRGTGHEVVAIGPYRMVRHPLYTAALIMYLGTALVFPTPWNWLAMGMGLIVLALKARLEDDFLARQLPGYRDYQQQVRRLLVPGVW